MRDAPSPRLIRIRKIELRAGATPRRYVAELAAALSAQGALTRVVLSPAAFLPGTLDWLFQFEAIAYRARPTQFEAATQRHAPAFAEAPDLVIDLAGDRPDDALPTVRLMFPAGPGETGLVSSLLDGEALALGIVVSTKDGARLLSRSLLAVERPFALAFALDAALARMRTLIVQAVARIGASEDSVTVSQSACTVGVARPLVFAAQSLATKIADRLTGRLKIADHWRIATRVIEDDAVFDRLAWPQARWSILPDDGGRYYADPFLVEHAGRRILFCEEYPYATAKGILSCAEINARGEVGPVRPFLETAAHLSWPNVFAQGDAIYMLPESAGANRLELWRAVDFPDRWVLDRVLIDNIRLHDPILHFDDDGAHLLATIDSDGGSSWDALALFHAPGLFGPWRADERNPLLVDASAARPAGPIVRRADGLWRAVQDCRGGYGTGLALCRITRLGLGGYAQEVATRLAPPLAGAQGVHTLARLGTLEAIDIRGVAVESGRPA